MLKFLIGGSPCTHWSIAQNKNRETDASGEGWELFKNFLIAKERFKPDFYLYENNKSAAQAVKDQIGRELQAPLQYINSALVSAQNRHRFYVHNFEDVPEPEDRGILLKHVLDNDALPVGDTNGKSYCLTSNYSYTPYPEHTLTKSVRSMAAEPFCVAQRGRYTGGNGGAQQNFEPRFDGKTNTLATVQKDNLVCTPVRAGDLPNSAGHVSGSQANRIYSIDGKSINLIASNGGGGVGTGLYAMPEKAQKAPKIYKVAGGNMEIKGKLYPIKLPDGLYAIRKLTVAECCRLQTLPDGYCRAVSKTQAYKGLGNGWTAEVIIHLLSHALRGIPKSEPIAVLSVYDGIGTGRYCFDRLGYKNITYYAYEVDKHAIAVAMSNYPDIKQCGDAFNVREPGWFLQSSQGGKTGRLKQNHGSGAQLSLWDMGAVPD